MNKLLEKSLTFHNYENARKKAIAEEPRYESYMPPSPKFEKPVIQKQKVGWFNFFRVLLP